MGDNIGEDVARLIYIEEINPRSGGHDIPFQRQRIIDVANALGADKLIVDCTGIGGAIEQDLRLACINSTPQIHFIGFVFTGGPKGTKTQMYRDYQSYIQQQRVVVPKPDNLAKHEARLINKWIREHFDLQYTMDASQKTERIAAPTGKHDDYCDSSAMGLHATLSMLPGAGSFGQVDLKQGTTQRINRSMTGKVSGRPLFTTRQRNVRLNKHRYGNF